jgi:c-di-GMP-binding flagellar brake protein YcgR
MRIENLPCSLGTVLDLSASGMRVITSKISAKQTGEVIPVELNGTHHSAKLMAEVTWGERVGFRKHVIGLHFLNLSEEQRQKIGAIARTYAIRMGMGA